MRKTFHVALREYLENLRTKTFWIGIFALPVVFALFIVAGRLLQDSKDVRRYAIHDRSGWLAGAIAERAAQSDLRAIQAAATADDPAERDAGQQRLRDWYETLPDDHPLVELRARLEAVGGDADVDLDQILQPGAGVSGLPPAVAAELRKWVFEVAAQPERLEKLTSMASGLSLSRYRRVELAEFGLEPDADAETVEARLNEALSGGDLFGYFVIPEDPVASDDGAGYVSNNLTDNDLRNWFAGYATSIVRDRRIAAAELTAAQARAIQDEFEFPGKRVGAGGKTEAVGASARATSFAPVAFVYLLWIAVFTAAQMLLTNTVEEKSNRLIEVLLSSVSPLQLMSGKVLGIAATGLTIVVSWVLTAVVGAKLVPESSPLGGADLIAIIGNPLYLTSFVAYFLAGYLLYAAILVALGSVCDSLKEAQNLMQPVFILLIVPLVAMIFVVQDPNGAVARALTYVPLYTPFLMMNRAGGPPPVWEYVASTALILVSLVIAFWAAAKIFRIGILMTGKPPRIREILRWLRTPVGAVTRDPAAPG